MLRENDRAPWFVGLLLAFLFFQIGHDISLPTADPDKVVLTKEIIEEGSQPRRVGFLGLGALGLYLLLRRRYPVHGGGLLGAAFAAFMIWCAASLLWAEFPFTTLKRVITAGCTAIAAAGIARYYSGTALLKLALIAIGTLVATGLGSAVYHGTFRPWDPSYRLVGTLHPNATGLLAAGCSLAALALTLTDAKRRWIYWSCFALGVLIVLVTKSRSSLAAVLIGFFAFALLSWSRERKGLVFFAGATAACSGLFAYGDVLSQLLLEGILLGRGDEEAVTLTGRIPLWSQLLGFVAERPWTGAAYHSFWTPETLDAVERVQDWEIESAHSAYVEILLDLGIFGLVTYVTVLITALTRAVRQYHAYREPVTLYWVMLLLLAIFAGGLESLIPGYPGMMVQFMAFVGIWRLAYVNSRRVIIPTSAKSGFEKSQRQEQPEPPALAAR